MTGITRLFLTALLASAGSNAALARSQDDATAGHKLALEVCAACHVVAKDQRIAPIMNPPAPSLRCLRVAAR